MHCRHLIAIFLLFSVSSAHAVKTLSDNEISKFKNIPKETIFEDDTQHTINQYGQCWGSDKNKRIIVKKTKNSFDAGIVCFVNKDRDYHKNLRTFTDPLAEKHCRKYNSNAYYRGVGNSRDAISATDTVLGIITLGLSGLITKQNNVIAVSYVCDGVVSPSKSNSSLISFWQIILIMIVGSLIFYYFYFYKKNKTLYSFWSNLSIKQPASLEKDIKEESVDNDENDSNSIDEESKIEESQTPEKEIKKGLSGHQKWFWSSIIFGGLVGLLSGNPREAIILTLLIYGIGMVSYVWVNLFLGFMGYGDSIYDYIVYGDGNYSKNKDKNNWGDWDDQYEVNNGVISTGSGFFINEDGFAVTNFHVIEQFVQQNAKKIMMHIKGKDYEASVFALDVKNDLAVLKTNEKTDSYFQLSYSDSNRLDSVTTIGFGLGIQWSSEVKITKGVVSAISGAQNDYSRMQIDAVVQSGNSGGPTVSDNGSVTGVVVEKASGKLALEQGEDIPEGVGFAIKVSTLKQFLSSNKVKYHVNENVEKFTSKIEMNHIIDNAALFITIHK